MHQAAALTTNQVKTLKWFKIQSAQGPSCRTVGRQQRCVTMPGRAQARQILLPSPTEGLGKHRARHGRHLPAPPGQKHLEKSSLQIRATCLHEEPRTPGELRQEDLPAGDGYLHLQKASSWATAHLYCSILQPPPLSQLIPREFSCSSLLAAVSSTLGFF